MCQLILTKSKDGRGTPEVWFGKDTGKRGLCRIGCEKGENYGFESLLSKFGYVICSQNLKNQKMIFHKIGIWE